MTYYERNKEACKENARQYYAANREKRKQYYAAHRNELIEYQKTVYYKKKMSGQVYPSGWAWLKSLWEKDPSKAKAHVARWGVARRLRKLSVGGFIEYGAIKSLFDSCSNCKYCNKPLSLREKTIDHVMPLSRGGRHVISNLEVCCLSCNSSKWTRTVSEWNEWKRSKVCNA